MYTKMNSINKLVIVLLIIITSSSFSQQENAGKYVDVNGMKMYYEVSGEGDPLIVLHGGHMDIITMGKIISMLAESHQVYALEFQGHGHTEDIDRPITYENLVDDVSEFMDAVGIEKADVFGYSMGGQVGLKLAISHPQKLNKLITASVAYDLNGCSRYTVSSFRK